MIHRLNAKAHGTVAALGKAAKYLVVARPGGLVLAWNIAIINERNE